MAGSSIASVAKGGRIQRHVANLARPQDSFPDPIDNSETPWSPAKFPHLAVTLAAAAAHVTDQQQQQQQQHPVRGQLDRLQYQPWQLQGGVEGQGVGEGLVDLDAAPCTFVDTAEGLQAMVTALEGVKQVAIDLEHHSYRCVA